MYTYSLKTDDITVAVQPLYLETESDPSAADYCWAYTVSIQNDSSHPIEVKGRNWRIVDRNGFIQEIKGEGVVGQKPIIKPGEAYEYTSMANLQTCSGVILGSYDIETDSGEKMSAQIPAFSLDSPEAMRRPN